MNAEIKGNEMPRGGKREGAGRPTRQNAEGKNPRVSLDCRVEEETMNWLLEEKNKTQESLGEVVDKIVDRFRHF